jgi:hypothetical protein
MRLPVLDFASLITASLLEETMKSFIMAGLFLGSGALMACSSDNTSTGAGGGDSSSSKATTSASTGMSAGGGGQGGDGQGGGGQGGSGQGGGGGGSAMSAKLLGQVCNNMTPCPMGYDCIFLEKDAASGFCSLPCEGQFDTMTCTNGFPGPGKGTCNINVSDGMGGMTIECGIACGDYWMPPLPTDCPTGLTCKDLIGPNMKPDGKTDLCAP